jgi:hypothetical protein
MQEIVALKIEETKIVAGGAGAAAAAPVAARKVPLRESGVRPIAVRKPSL